MGGDASYGKIFSVLWQLFGSLWTIFIYTFAVFFNKLVKVPHPYPPPFLPPQRLSCCSPQEWSLSSRSTPNDKLINPTPVLGTERLPAQISYNKIEFFLGVAISRGLLNDRVNHRWSWVERGKEKNIWCPPKADEKEPNQPVLLSVEKWFFRHRWWDSSDFIPFGR